MGPIRKKRPVSHSRNATSASWFSIRVRRPFRSSAPVPSNYRDFAEDGFIIVPIAIDLSFPCSCMASTFSFFLVIYFFRSFVFECPHIMAQRQHMVFSMSTDLGIYRCRVHAGCLTHERDIAFAREGGFGNFPG